MQKFGSLKSLFHQIGGQDDLDPIASIEPEEFLRSISDSFEYVLECEVRRGPLLSTSTIVRDYLFQKLAGAQKEMFRVLYLDANNRLIEDKLLGLGTVNRTNIYVREVVREALALNATALILVHNHPSGDCTPSPSDIDTTQQIARLCASFDLEIIDHLIVARNGVASLRNLDLLNTNEPVQESNPPTKPRSMKLFQSIRHSVQKRFRSSPC